MSGEKQQVSRRQFLNYTLTGVGGFMAAGIMVPMLRMAVDPVLKPSGHGDFHNVNLSVDDISNDPQRVEWEVEQVDGWYKSKVQKAAWVYKDDGGNIIALSPICKHLGCIVTWEGSEQYPNEFYCPCHDGRYYKSGVNVPGTPPTAPLDMYEKKVEDGMLYLGDTKPHKEA
ncbi:Menaquinol-cytochrome c reductase iron-sulfur subunit [Lentibacillus sp. JNUCC-1]|uniref:QcrA and Rieske domain-containing protein n=1 Tax=Lentibacillus sp. JNUCC-1 TaxID=2654513 RepID=UPI0012E7FBFF|nr:ubiquinol-cytochrome c reductase iron-sulfur subunit [Lentibacillus sp. JNUCC-1]MUV39784.1 Menaquinol-cytochrome c reductase iron-sulfur subunit [Lentibacillus sp. JNUCC-1]